jgi:HK97 family phage major capsid protein
MDIVKLRNEYAAKITEAKALAAKWQGKEAEMPKADADAINALLGQADEVKVKLDLANRMQAGDAYLNEPVGTKAAHLGWREAGPTEGDPDVDPKAWREVEVSGKTVRYNVPLAVQTKGYAAAFEGYLRKGMGDLGPTDRKTLTEGVDSAGGFLVPEDFQAELVKKIAAQTVIRANARVVQTSRDIVRWPRVAYTTDDIYTSGVRLTWTGESPASATTHRVTDPVYGNITIPVHTAMASMPISNDLIEDAAFDVVGQSSDLLSEAFAIGEDAVFVSGTGAGQPMGFMSEVSTTVDSTAPAYVASGAAGTLTANGLIDLAFALPDQYDRNAKWYMAKATEKVIRKLVGTTSGDYLYPIGGVGLERLAAPELLGYPIVRCVNMPALTTNAYPIAFGDMRGYIVADRVGFSVQRLTELYAETNITLLLARKRVGGYCAEPWRLRVQKIATS